MPQPLQTIADAILSQTTGRAGGVPGVVAMATDRQGNFYEGAAGRRSLGGEAPMTLDTVMAMFSTSKALTGTLVMQLVEEGRLSLDDAARQYAPELGEIEVLQGFDAAGQPITRPPRRDITINDLMLHISGMGYEFFSADDLKYRAAKGLPSIIDCKFAGIRTVMLHEPGERWTYGPNIDWLGRIIEQQRGKGLGAVMQERLFDPLGMADTAFVMNDSMKARRAVIHDRAQDGRLTPLPDLTLPQPPEMEMGGHGLYGTVGDYMKFIRMMLNDGAGAHGRVLKAETVERMSRNGLPTGMSSGGWSSSIPSLTNVGEFDPGISKTWAYTFQRNEEATRTGRPAGSLSWAGLGNLFYWIDRTSGIGGFWASQILPFQDAASYPSYVEFETAVYAGLKR